MCPWRAHGHRLVLSLAPLCSTISSGPCRFMAMLDLVLEIFSFATECLVSVDLQSRSHIHISTTATLIHSFSRNRLSIHCVPGSRVGMEAPALMALTATVSSPSIHPNNSGLKRSLSVWHEKMKECPVASAGVSMWKSKSARSTVHGSMRPQLQWGHSASTSFLVRVPRAAVSLSSFSAKEMEVVTMKQKNQRNWPTSYDTLRYSVQFSCSVVSDSLRSHGLQHARLPCPSSTPRVHSNSCPLSQWCHPTISSSVVPFSSRLQSSPASGSFRKVSSLHQVAKVLEFQLQHQSFQWIFRTDFL